MPPRHEGEVRPAIVSAMQKLSRLGLSPGRSGNISVRFGKGMLITASAVAPDEMMPDTSVVFCGDGGEKGEACAAPSTEWHFHAAIYRHRPSVGSVVHCHSRYATALACLRKPIPAFHYMVAKAGGGEIPLAPYATFGTEALADKVVEALGGLNACLLANHGQIAVGKTLAEAVELAEEVETLAAQYIAALSAGTPVLLTASEIAEVIPKFATYGKPRS